MVILDTDHISLLERRATSAQGRKLGERLDAVPAIERAATIVSYEEQLRGWLSVLAKARKMTQQIEAYRRLKRQLENYCRMLVLDFEERAATEFQRLVKARLRIATMDLKIAAIALAHDATLLTRNLADFHRVPGLKVEDWTA